MQKLKKEFTLSKSKGFTLIELLVVIAIIAILATIVIINVTAARTKANDTKVLSEITEANKGAMACYANGAKPIAPNVAETVYAAGSTSVGPLDGIDSANVSVCDTATSGLGANWPYLFQGSGTYSQWKYDANAGADLVNGDWSWTATHTDVLKKIIFNEKNATKSNF